MSSSNVSAQIGKAWGFHREGRNNDAIREFETILASAPNEVDALYGLGLAQKADGQQEAAIKSFSKALGLAKDWCSGRLSGDARSGRGQLAARREHRYMMLVRMLNAWPN
jgi:tetratricopeptide (TPR) repeat protein